MSWVNYHSHSLFCDGKAVPEEFIKAAIAKEFPAYGFSSHAPVPFPSVWNMKENKLQEYIDEISRIKLACRDKIQVYIGLELDYIDGTGQYPVSMLKEMGLDYVIGSVHYINRYPDGSYFCFDGQPDAFFRGIEQIYHNNFRKAITGYYQSVRSMIENDCPDIIGHMDKIKMHNTVRPYFNEEESWFRKEVEETLDLISEKGCIMEVNTRGLYKHNPPMLYPASWIIRQAYQRNIPIMLNSDAHHPDEIDSGFSETSVLLKETGFETLRVLLDGNWQDRPFNENGLE